MSISDVLYNLIVMPIQIIVETTYSVMNGILGNKGLAIVAVSFVIQTLILPLYKRADALQEEETSRQNEMSKYVSHIKRTFRGDEKYMMLTTYYRQQHYKMWFPLKSSISILLQIPFFIAAYNYLSKLQELSGVSFLFINDLSKPDAMFSVGGFKVNILPIMMTVFNLISCLIYSKNLPTKTKLQGYGLALIFLFLLYASPSGIVLYWMCNNLYSLMKNVFMKLLKKPERDIAICSALICLLIGIYLFSVGSISVVRTAVLVLIAIACQVPMLIENKDKIVKIVPDELKLHEESVNKGEKKVNLFFTSIFMSVLTGLFIPLSVISSSASEFSIDGSNPMGIVANSFTVFAGLFVIWTSVFYFLMPEKARNRFSIVYSGIAIAGLLTYLLFANIHGRISYLLRYDSGLVFSKGQHIASSLIFIAVIVLVLFLCVKYYKTTPRIINGLFVILTMGMVLACMNNTSKVNDSMEKYYEAFEKQGRENLVTLSKKGKNVIFIMLDRAIGPYVPYIIDEKPELADAFEGFTYYSNTISYGGATNFGAPALFGGYEYTPEEMNRRDTELLSAKHNEALKVLPKMFSDNGFNVTVCDPPYAGYTWVPNLSIYDDIPNVRAYITEGAFNMYVSGNTNLAVQKSRFIYYSISKILPTILQNRLYRDGHYYTTLIETQTQSSPFLDSYYAIDNMNIMTRISNDDTNNVLIYQNSVTHMPTILKTPEYIPSEDINVEEELARNSYMNHDGIEMKIDNIDRLAHYHVNVSAYLRIAEYLQFLKENGVYDNTRIIISSDHGYGLEQFAGMCTEDGFDIECVSPVLIFKDFGARGVLKLDDSFMTNADAPIMAVMDIIKNPVNPYTGKKFDNEAKFKQKQLITASELSMIGENHGYVFNTDDKPWYSIYENKNDMSKWDRMDTAEGNN